ncbi:MAG: hypothetical protein WCF26_26680 [Candidatus Sulfotelmatobacter sp.]
MSSESNNYASRLRQELIARNQAFAKVNRLPHVISYGESPVVVYQPSECGRYHGNFVKASYEAILNDRNGASGSKKSMLRADGAFQREVDNGVNSILL